MNYSYIINPVRLVILLFVMVECSGLPSKKHQTLLRHSVFSDPTISKETKSYCYWSSKHLADTIFLRSEIEKVAQDDLGLSQTFATSADRDRPEKRSLSLASGRGHSKGKQWRRKEWGFRAHNSAFRDGSLEKIVAPAYSSLQPPTIFFGSWYGV